MTTHRQDDEQHQGGVPYSASTIIDHSLHHGYHSLHHNGLLDDDDLHASIHNPKHHCNECKLIDLIPIKFVTKPSKEQLPRKGPTKDDIVKQHGNVVGQ